MCGEDVWRRWVGSGGKEIFWMRGRFLSNRWFLDKLSLLGGVGLLSDFGY